MQRIKNSHTKEAATLVQKVSVFLEIDMAEVERRVAASGELSDAERLAKLFDVPVEIFKPGVDIYTAIAAHVAEVEPHEVTKVQRNYVKSKLVEWLYVGS